MASSETARSGTEPFRLVPNTRCVWKHIAVHEDRVLLAGAELAQLTISMTQSENCLPACAPVPNRFELKLCF